MRDQRPQAACQQSAQKSPSAGMAASYRLDLQRGARVVVELSGHTRDFVKLAQAGEAPALFAVANDLESMAAQAIDRIEIVLVGCIHIHFRHST